MNNPAMIPFRTLLHVLAETTHFHPASPPGIPLDWPDEAWDRLIALAHHHRVTPLLAYRAQCGDLPEWPPEVMRRLQKSLHTCRLRHLAGSRELARISAAFKAADTSFIPLKGPSLADEAYADTGLRPFDDLDVLVEPSHTSRVETILMDLGYRALASRLSTRFMRRYHFHTQWVHEETRQCIEIHWHPADTRNAPHSPNVASYVRELHEDPAAMPVYLATHIAKHGYANKLWLSHQSNPLLVLHPWSDIRLLWLLDFQGLCAKRKLNRDMLTRTAERWRTLPALSFVQHLIAPPRAQHIPLPGTLPRFSPKAAILRRMNRDLDLSAAPPPSPWCLRANQQTGFRPIRFFDLFERNTL